MSDNAQTAPTTNDANAVLMNQVAVPSYFTKMASGGWPTPRTDAAARQQLQLADMVKQAVDGYIASHENDEAARSEQAIKTAADVAMEIAGIRPTAHKQANDNSDFLSDAGIRGAAEFLVQAQLKAAMEGMEMPSPSPTEEEEEEKKKKEAEAAKE